METFVHPIGEIDASDSSRFGGKATGLARMADAGIPVPPAFVVGTDGYRAYRDAGSLPDSIVAQVQDAMRGLESATGRTFGTGTARPLLVSVRSGAKVSMPGMMDTVLNLGITASGALALAQETGNAEFAVDTWMRFWRMFCDIVLDADGEAVASSLAALAADAKATPKAATFAAMEEAVVRTLVEMGVDDVQADPHWQLQRAIAAVFESWDSRRAKAYRAHHKIADDLGTAVTVQAMVFGNFDERSGSGVAFTRNPNTGEREIYGEFLLGRQGEDLVSGSATPLPLQEPGGLSEKHRRELFEHGQQLERIYSDAVDIEFTIEGERLYFLQVRAAKRTAQAAVRIAADLVEDGIVSEAAALKKVSVDQLKRLLRPTFEPGALAAASVLVEGIGASPGHSYGIAVLDADRAAAVAASGERVILLRPTTSPQDIRGMLASQAIVTARGGALSHAAVVSRALDVPCVVGCEALEIDLDKRTFVVGGGAPLQEGAPLSVDGATGRVYSGILPLEAAAHAEGHIDRLLGWSDKASGANFWISGVCGGDVKAALLQNPNGFGVVALSDLLIAAGTLDDLIDSVNDLSHQPERKDTHDRIARLTYEACRHLMLESSGVPIDLRLPNLGSPRAQRLIGTWASLAPRLFLPLGLKGLYVSILRGISDAAKETGHGAVTPLAAAVTSTDELDAFHRAATSFGLRRSGAVLQSQAGVSVAATMAGQSSVLWVDIREILRTFYGYPSALSFGDDVFEGYIADGYLSQNPRTKLSAPLEKILTDLVQRVSAASPGVRLGVECGDGTAVSLIEDLYRVGFRIFSVPQTASAGARLALGQLAGG